MELQIVQTPAATESLRPDMATHGRLIVRPLRDATRTERKKMSFFFVVPLWCSFELVC